MFMGDNQETVGLMREQEEKVSLVDRKQQQQQQEEEDESLAMKRHGHHDPLAALNDDQHHHPWHLEHWYYSDGVIYERPSSTQTRRRQRQSRLIQWQSSSSYYSTSIFAYRILLVLIVLCSLLVQHTAEATSKSPLDNINVNVPPSKSTITSSSSSSNNSILPMTEETTSCANNDGSSIEAAPKKKKKMKSKQTESSSTTSSTASSSPTTTLSGSQSNFIRRVQREWKDAVQMGIAYDWSKGKPTGSKKNASQNNHQYMCLGPLSRHNLLQWHFSFRGMEGSPFEGGIYHGRLVLPPNYPAAPPRVQVWTPSGRFTPRADICLSASSFHPETWNPAAFNLRTIIESLRLHMLTHAMEIGGIHRSTTEQRKLAKESRTWKQPVVTSKKRNEGIMIDHAKLIQQGVFPSLAEEEEVDTSNTTESLATTSPNDAVNDENTTTDNSAITDSSPTIPPMTKKKGKKKKKKITSIQSTPGPASASDSAYPSDNDQAVHDAAMDSQETSLVQRKAIKKGKKKKKANTSHKVQLRRREETTGLLATIVTIISKNRPLRYGLIFVFLYCAIFGGF